MSKDEKGHSTGAPVKESSSSSSFFSFGLGSSSKEKDRDRDRDGRPVTLLACVVALSELIGPFFAAVGHLQFSHATALLQPTKKTVRSAAQRSATDQRWPGLSCSCECLTLCRLLCSVLVSGSVQIVVLERVDSPSEDTAGL
jgi:hypothetical protein